MSSSIAAYAEGHFSIVDATPFTVEAQPGLLIHVHAGRLQVQHNGAPALGVTAGEDFVVPGAGPLTVRCAARTHIELQCDQAAALRP